MLTFRIFQPWKAKLHFLRTVYEAANFLTVWNAHFLQISAAENKKIFCGEFTRHKTLPRVQTEHFRAQVTIIVDSRFFFWSVQQAHFKSLYNNWRLSVIANFIVQWNEVRLLNRPKKVLAISDSQILFFFFRLHFSYHHNFWTSVP